MECTKCRELRGAKLYGHLFDKHNYNKEQIETMKEEERERKAADTGRPILSCEFCGAMFTSKNYLLRHERTKHSEQYSLKTIACPLCDEEVKVTCECCPAVVMMVEDVDSVTEP